MGRKVIYTLVLALFAAGTYFYFLNVRKDMAVTGPLPASPEAPRTMAEESPKPPAGRSEQEPAAEPAGPAVRIGSLVIPVDLALTDTERQKGLSGRPSLDADKGMLFVFDKPAIYNFWMPDMNFPIDIIWINSGKVVSVTANATNDFDPANPVYYRPPSPAQYVLEVNAGFAARHGITAGDGVELPNVQAQ